MEYNYVLRIASTGQYITKEKSPDRIAKWQKKVERKLLKHKGRTEEVKQAIRNKDTIASWEDYDQFVRDGMGAEELAKHCRFVWSDTSMER